MNRPLAVLMALLAGACEPPLLLSPDELQALDSAEARWAARGFADYRFERHVGCNCPPAVTQWMRVDVVGGRVTQIVNVDSVGTLPGGVILFTVEQLFKSIRSANDVDSFEDLIVEFDPQLGFPTRVSWVPDESQGTDAGFVYRLRNVTPLPASPP